MYKRLTEEEKLKLRQDYDSIHEYTVCYNAIDAVSEHYDDLSPEEVWSEALLIVEEIKRSTNKKWKINTIYSQLKRKYDSFDNGIKRSEEQREHTATMVLFDVVMMLTIAKKVDVSSAEEHPYFEYIVSILNYIGHTTLFEAMLAVTHQNEIDIEEMVGEELTPYDYLRSNNIPKKTSLEEPKSLNDDEKRRACLQKIYKKLKLEKDFEGGSQWFYIYKLMAETHIYEDYSYTLFMNDLEHIGVQSKHMPKTSTFARKYKQLKPDTKYPHWKVKSGGKQPPLDKGKRLAKIAFEILLN